MRKWVLAAVIAVAAVVLGFVIARAGDSGTQPAPHDRHAANGVLSVSFPAGWQRQPVPQNVTHGLSDALALAPKAPARGVLVLGHTQSPATSQVSQVLSGQPTVSGAQIVTLGGVRFYRYSVKSSPTAGSSSSLYALPTTSGTVVGVCSMQGARPAFAAECERILASLRLASARPLIAGPSTAFGAALSGVITKLTSTRTTAERQLAAAQSGAAQAHAASALAAAYRHAAAAVGGLSAGQASGATAALAQALGKTADSYTALARAAATGDGTSYRAAEQTLSTERAAVATAIAQLGAFGYRAA